MRHLALVFVLFTSACLEPIGYPCTSSNQCSIDGKQGGFCEPTTHWCVYDDPACGSGRRYGPAAGDGLADQCAETDSIGGTGGASSSSDSSSETTGCGPCDDPPSPCFVAPGKCNPESGACEYDQLAVDSPCEDDDPCTMDGMCDATATCVPETTIECTDPPSPCHTNPGTCDEVDGSCIYELVQAGTDCEDGDACTIDDTCEVDPMTMMLVCTPGEICTSDDPCQTGMCTDGACVFAPVDDGTSCGVNQADRCCAGMCVDISTDTANCGGCGAACAPGKACESVASTSECDPHPAATSGRCICAADSSECPLGQVCRTLTPAANRCAPEDASECAGTFVDVNACPNYCAYPA